MKRSMVAVVCVASVAAIPGCQWRGLNSLPLPGTAGGGPGSYVIQAQMPDVVTLRPNSAVRVNDVKVGNITKIEVQDWHALVTMRIDGKIHLPANSTAKLGQTSLLGATHIELAPPTNEPPEGELKDGSVIPLSQASMYPTTEQTLAALSMLLNGGGIGRLQEIVQAFAKALDGREADARSLLTELDKFTAQADAQTHDIIGAIESLNALVGQVAAQDPVVDRALATLPKASAVLADLRTQIADAADTLGKFGAVAADTADKIKESLVANLRNIAPVLKSLADAGPALTRGLDMLSTYPWPKSTVANWFRGDYANITMVIDLTLSRIDSGIFTGTRFECNLTDLELLWGRTVGMQPSPCTAGNPYIPGNPLTFPYHQGGY